VTWTITFGFSLGTFPVLLGLGSLLGLGIGLWLRLLPDALQHAEGPWTGNPFFAIAGLMCLVITGCCASLLNRVLSAPARVRVDGAAPVRLGLDNAVIGLAVWVGCFLMGPILPVTLAWLYWMQCGDPALIDWIILGELLVPAVAYWLTAIFLVSATGRLTEATPPRVIHALWRLGSRGAAAVVLICVLLAGTWAAILTAGRMIHQDEPGGYLLLTLWTAGAVLASGVLFRELGKAHAALRAGQVFNLSERGTNRLQQGTT
jgi:hypothetical protein